MNDVPSWYHACAGVPGNAPSRTFCPGCSFFDASMTWSWQGEKQKIVRLTLSHSQIAVWTVLWKNNYIELQWVTILPHAAIDYQWLPLLTKEKSIEHPKSLTSLLFFPEFQKSGLKLVKRWVHLAKSWPNFPIHVVIFTILQAAIMVRTNGCFSPQLLLGCSTTM